MGFSNTFFMLLGLTALALVAAAGDHTVTKDGREYRIVDSVRERQGGTRRVASDLCLLNTTKEDCEAAEGCAQLVFDSRMICLAKETVDRIYSGLTTAGIRVVSPQKISCDTAGNADECSNTSGCSVFKHGDKVLCGPEEGGFSAQGPGIEVLDAEVEAGADIGIEHVNVLNSRISTDEYNLFGGLEAVGEGTATQLAGGSFNIGSSFTTGVRSEVTRDERTLGYAYQQNAGNSFDFVIPAIRFRTRDAK